MNKKESIPIIKEIKEISKSHNKTIIKNITYVTHGIDIEIESILYNHALTKLIDITKKYDKLIYISATYAKKLWVVIH